MKVNRFYTKVALPCDLVNKIFGGLTLELSAQKRADLRKKYIYKKVHDEKNVRGRQKTQQGAPGGNVTPLTGGS